MKLVSTDTMGRIDATAQETFGIGGIVLMEGAALRCSEILEQLVSGTLSVDALPSFSNFTEGPAFNRTGRSASPAGEKAPVLFFAGKGNNGGDALAMARLCATDAKFPVEIVLGFRDPGGLAGVQLRSCREMGIPVTIYEDDPDRVRTLLRNAAWVVDGLFGTGIRGALRPPVEQIVAAINESGRPVFAVDTPSGVGDSFRRDFPAVRAAVTATVGLPKKCLFLPSARPLCGRVVAVPISFPSALTADPEIPGEILTAGELGGLLPPLDSWTYKTKRGHLAVFAGAPGTAGAAVLCSTAAARSRTGLVTLYVEQAAYDAAAASCTSVMARPWFPDGDRPEALVPANYTAVLIGPGWGRDTSRSAWLEALVRCGLPGVIDADGLNVLSALAPEEQRSLPFAGKWVLTPHPGEFSRLRSIATGELLADPVTAACDAAKELNVVMVVKGHVTTVAAPDGRYWLVDGMNAAMATGGTGDLLSGIIAGLLASGLDAAQAARAGVLLHQEAGRVAFEENGWFLSEDLLPLLSRVLAIYQRQA